MKLLARNQDIVKRYRAGESITDLGAAYGVSRQRIWQLIPAAFHRPNLSRIKGWRKLRKIA